MNQVGIGDLKHAKKSIKVKKSFTGLSSKDHNSLVKQAEKEASEQPKEGQLAVDILQTEDKMIIVCPVAGVEKSDVNIAIQDDVLTIRGERKKIDSLNDREALVQELFWGTFSRSIVLPDHIDRKNISAKMHEHMLIITIPKTEDFKTRIIHINE